MTVTFEFKNRGEAETAIRYLTALPKIETKVVDVKYDSDERETPIITEERW